MKKTLYTLCVNNFAPEITALTFPLMRLWAEKIDAEFVVIEKRKWGKEFPVTIEKFQVFDLAKERGDDWSIFFDADALIHPDYYDPTALLNKDTTFSNGTDFTPIRFKPDRYFLRDGRFIGKGNWCLMASDWCREVWEVPQDLSVQEMIANIKPTEMEAAFGITAEHLIDDYIVSRNISKYGLKHKITSELEKEKNIAHGSDLLWHHWVIDQKEKLTNMRRKIIVWLSSYQNHQKNLVLANQYTGQASLGDYLTAAKAEDIIKRMEALGLPL